jgi:NUMOD4 motif
VSGPDFTHVSLTPKDITAGQFTHAAFRQISLTKSLTSLTPKDITAGQFTHEITHVTHGPVTHESTHPFRDGDSVTQTVPRKAEMLDDTGDNWVEIPGFEGFYAVSASGHVMSLPRVVPVRGQVPRRIPRRILRPAVRRSDGRRHVALSREGKLTTRGVEKLMREVGFRP